MIKMAIIIVLVEILLVGAVYAYENRKSSRISFKETLDLTNLPIITFYNNNTKLHFLLDTGSNRSILNQSELQFCTYRTTNTANELSGLDGVKRVVENVEIGLQYGDKVFTEEFQTPDMSEVFGSIKAETGVTIHGILGNTFFNRYKYIIDFDKCVFYSKKYL